MYAHLRTILLAEDMGLEEVRIVQTLKFKGEKASSTFVPGIVPDVTISVCVQSL